MYMNLRKNKRRSQVLVEIITDWPTFIDLARQNVYFLNSIIRRCPTRINKKVLRFINSNAGECYFDSTKSNKQ